MLTTKGSRETRQETPPYPKERQSQGSLSIQRELQRASHNNPLLEFFSRKASFPPLLFLTLDFKHKQQREKFLRVLFICFLYSAL